MILYVWKYENGIFNKTRVIDNATSIIWVTRYNSAGEFELYLPATTELLNLFHIDMNFDTETLITRDDSDRAMIVENVQLTTNAENGDFLTITGRSAESLLGRRIFPKQCTFQDTAELVIRRMINENVIQPSDVWRQMDFIALGELHYFPEMLKIQVTGKNLLDTISDICTSFNMGFKLIFSNGTFTFDLYKGVDHSFLQTLNDYVIFSPDFENLGNTEYTQDMTAYYNSVYVAGEGQGADRVIVEVSTQRGDGVVHGIALREKWIDARQTSSNTEEGGLTPTEYEDVLKTQGTEEITKSSKTETFNGETLDYNLFRFGVDYGLGDLVQIVNEYGLQAVTTVNEVTEVEDENGYRLCPSLSEWRIIYTSDAGSGGTATG